jgi:aldehyde dehydrogenase (NAD+)
MGKSLQEGYGEVQEMIDICDFAVGLSVNYGLTMHSERPGHRMYEQYHQWDCWDHFSFQLSVAVWAWNTTWQVCGDVCVWKPSRKNYRCVELPVRTLLPR